jgi:hypothetical protein
LALAAPALAPAQPIVASPPGPLARAADGRSEFREAFKKAQALNSAAEMQRLVKKHNAEAVSLIMDTAEGLSTNPGEILAKRMTALRKTWRAAIDTDFAENMEKYFSLMDPVQKRERGKLKARYDQANAKYWANNTKRASQVYGILSLEFEGLADQLALVGDHYFAAQAWILRSQCWTEANRGERADLYKICRSCKQAYLALARVDLRDRFYIDSKARYDSLAAQGYDKSLKPEDGEGGEPAPGTGPPAAGGAGTLGASSTVSFAFEMVEDLDDFERPNYFLDELHVMWSSVTLKKKGTKAKFSSLGDISPTILRDGSALATVDVDGDGKGDIQIRLTGNLEPLVFKIGQGDEQRDWGVLTRIGSSTDMYQGVQINMAPTDEQLSIFLVAGASLVGELNGVRLRILDDNMDGIYGSAPISWEHIGLSKGLLQPEMDSVVVGKSKRAVPFSEYLQVAGQWYKFETQGVGMELLATAVELKTGKAKLAFKGGKPTWLVLQGMGTFENSYFDVSRPTELPVGRYKLFYGELRKGKKQQMAKTVILPGKSMENFEVFEGKTTKIMLGGPFSYDFSFKEEESSIHLKGKTVVVIGTAGERYERPWNCVPRPLVSWRKKGSKKGSKPAKTHVIAQSDQFSEYGWDASWAPLDLVLEKRGKVEAAELQLSEKKNKLFGKIKSDWKE